MSETDDRMERAERIRKMRQSREPDDEQHDVGEADPGDGADQEMKAQSAGDADTGPDSNGAASSADRAGTDDQSAGNGSGHSVSQDRSPTDAERPSANGARSQTPPATDGTAGRQATGDGATAATNGDGATAAANAAGAAQDAAAGAPAPLGGSAGFDLPDQADSAAADGEADETDPTGTGRGAARARGTTATTEASVRVLEFTVGQQVYCIDIERVEEIVKREAVTRVPNTDDYVEGVVDLRGQITTILDTKRLLDVDADGPESLLVIFAPDAFEEHGTVGWVVDEVRQVVPVLDEQVRSPPTEQDHVRGVVDRDDEDELVVWVRPGETMSRAVDVDDVE